MQRLGAFAHPAGVATGHKPLPAHRVVSRAADPAINSISETITAD
jgi:hypothetical protein